MSLRERTQYRVVCDTCRRSFGDFFADRYLPQQVLRIVELEYGWHVDDETTICATCPHPSSEEAAGGQG